MTRTVFMLSLLLVYSSAWSESKRIEVYPISQQYWDVSKGDTLSGIANNLLPNNPNMQLALMDDILRLNPDAFIGGNRHLLLAGRRLWLPGSIVQPDTSVDRSKHEVRSFSWGNIKKPKE